MLSLFKSESLEQIEQPLQFDVAKNRLLLGKTFDYEYLTQRELDVLKYVIQGYTAKKIAIVLALSYRTVEAYIVTLKLKLRCATKGELIEVSIKTGLYKYFFR